MLTKKFSHAVHEISNNVVCATSQASDQHFMIVKLLTEHHLEFLSLKGGCRGSSELYLSKCQIVGNLMWRLIFLFLGVKLALSPEKADVPHQTGSNLIYLVCCDLEN